VIGKPTRSEQEQHALFSQFISDITSQFKLGISIWIQTGWAKNDIYIFILKRKI